MRKKRITDKMLTDVPVSVVFRLAVEHDRDAMPLFERWNRLNIREGDYEEWLLSNSVRADTVISDDV